MSKEKPEIGEIEIDDSQWNPKVTAGSAGGFVDLKEIPPKHKEKVQDEIANRLEEEDKRPQQAYYNADNKSLQILYLH
ncbi:MAG: hypothetical protein V5A57_03460 [Candidatus Paceibacterota bacterium]